MIFNTILNKNIDLLGYHSNVIIVDPINKMTVNSENFSDSFHLTTKGNKVLANEIFENLKSLIN